MRNNIDIFDLVDKNWTVLFHVLIMKSTASKLTLILHLERVLVRGSSNTYLKFCKDRESQKT